MRMLIFPLLMIATTAIQANRMHVVVSTRDRVVLEYRCEQRVSALDESPAIRRILRDPGHLVWHGVGGVAPYTLISDERDQFGNICITIMDATGNMATGCSILRERRVTIPVECEPDPSDRQFYTDTLRADYKKIQEHIAYRDSIAGSSNTNEKKERGVAPTDRDARDRGTRDPATRERREREIVISRDRGVSGTTRNERPVRERHHSSGDSGTSTPRQGRSTQSTGYNGGSGNSRSTVSPR